jgi:phospholipase C
MGPGERTRREALAAIAAVGATAAWQLSRSGAAGAAERHRHRHHHRRFGPGDRPFPKLPEGTDLVPQIRHVVVVMMENHSFDNYLGTLGRGDGFDLDRHGRPRDTNRAADGTEVRAFRMPSTCQLDHEPSNAWNASHISLGARLRNDGFVRGSGPVAMGYWTGDDLPFYHSLASRFPLCDRWFASCLAQTYPNRKYLMAGTSSGQIRTDLSEIGKAPPPNGTIFERLDAHGISWRNYHVNLPQVALFPPVVQSHPDSFPTIDQFFSDARTGGLPAFSLVDPDFIDDGSEENNADVRVGEQFVAKVVDAVMHSPAWPHTMLIWTYDEGGGYYDHVVPPRAIAPDTTAPFIDPATDRPGGFDRYGFRVPAVIVSPYARKRYVSHEVHDHTSVLKLLETKWNLPALTYRDANASNLLDSLDLDARRPAFLEPPVLAAAPGRTACVEGQPGPIPAS